MAFFNSAVTVLQTLVIALGAGLGIWGAINLLEGYGNDNPGANFDSRVRYEATDINLDNIELVNKILSLYDLQAKIYGSDILCDIPNGEWDVVFLFKIVPLLEQQKKGYFRSIIEQINSKFFIITFPTKSISGKNVGMKDYYENMMTKYIENSQMEIIFRKAYFNEIMFVIKK